MNSLELNRIYRDGLQTLIITKKTAKTLTFKTGYLECEIINNKKKYKYKEDMTYKKKIVINKIDGIIEDMYINMGGCGDKYLISKNYFTFKLFDETLLIN